MHPAICELSSTMGFALAGDQPVDVFA